MIKKILLLLLALCFFIPIFVKAEEDWSSYSNIDNVWDGQKSITNKQFEETMDALQARQKKKEAKKREKAIRKVKGSSLIPEMDAHNDDMVSDSPANIVDEAQLINIPVDFIVNGQAIERGFYKVVGEKQGDNVYILLYQAHSLKAKIKARETDDDFDEQYIQFVKLLPFSEHKMKLIFGSLSFNAVAYINVMDFESTF